MQACDNAQGLCPHQVLAHINGATTSQDGVSLVYPRPSRNVSLRLQGLQEKDSGSYRCSVNVQDKQGTSRGHSSKTLKLDVWGKKHTPSSTSPPQPSPMGG